MFSDFELNLKDSSDQTFPGNSKIEVYKQTKNANGDNAIGDHIKDIFTDDLGTAILEYPAGEYAPGLKAAIASINIFGVWILPIKSAKFIL